MFCCPDKIFKNKCENLSHFPVFQYKVQVSYFINLRACDTYHKSNLVNTIVFPQFLIFQQNLMVKYHILLIYLCNNLLMSKSDQPRNQAIRVPEIEKI